MYLYISYEKTEKSGGGLFYAGEGGMGGEKKKITESISVYGVCMYVLQSEFLVFFH